MILKLSWPRDTDSYTEMCVAIGTSWVSSSKVSSLLFNDQINVTSRNFFSQARPVLKISELEQHILIHSHSQASLRDQGPVHKKVGPGSQAKSS